MNDVYRRNYFFRTNINDEIITHEKLSLFYISLKILETQSGCTVQCIYRSISKLYQVLQDRAWQTYFPSVTLKLIVKAEYYRTVTETLETLLSSYHQTTHAMHRTRRVPLNLQTMIQNSDETCHKSFGNNTVVQTTATSGEVSPSNTLKLIDTSML